MFRRLTTQIIRRAPVVSSQALFRPATFVVAQRFYSAGSALEHSVIRDRIFDVLRDFDKVNLAKLSETAEFTADLGLDSLDTVEVVMAIEEEFGVEIPDEEADSINSVAKAIEFISKQEGAN